MSDRRNKRDRGQRDQEGEPMEAEEEKFELDDDNEM